MGTLKDWLQVSLDLLFNVPPDCSLCSGKISSNHFLEYPIDSLSTIINGHKENLKIGKQDLLYIARIEADLKNKVCRECTTQIPIICGSYCEVCGRKTDQHICNDCKGNGERNFIYSRAATQYSEFMQQMIHLWKYRGNRQVGIFLESLISHAYRRYFHSIPIDKIVPVPLHRNRLAERGFNQAEYLANAVSKCSGIPVCTHLQRVEETEKQSKKTKQDRARSLADAFRYIEYISDDRCSDDNVFSSDKEDLKNQKILIIDDIYTTGTTIDSCAKVLRDAGASEVYALVLSR
ncbi:hypothetical protein BHU72_00135 [Desulfuribacillus stibiiarsenatis]|uniref:Phosphoribosyltransferase domain-containing protein n=1 Tax=Desulfuribacillus stibiiarsenatis TaxID=1390249 RepID=A0A1E5L9B2_9FIRM|nr:ComF family protein [Desulfuribacillus stibiiarsenatis]OEH86721.1 hypothetical protein BHU72_00135 [Desulfuribacillus stibiiarsenatis]